ncbi:TIGR01244 family sulfur transferase [Rhodobacter maris]|uniref:Uncharacterized protein (TIGR01244 family) n=1 Tax=Rhodobacter maris TaxID=446682 RepID=A0A285SYH4_9RHOB|nr:TIGR01244 family sulfur transferase [Rhodobacter maris]SOC11885.1 uncharacterized protein (TIGR01244 family) [Rhodobacter maris]
MLDLRFLAPDFAVAPQIDLADVAEAARLGFRTLINNRPDAEVPPGLQHEAFRASAETAGLHYHFLPYEPGELTPDLIAGFEAARHTAPSPVLAWCRSGTRCSHLWALSEAPNRPIEDILRATIRAGYDLSALELLMRARATGRG